MANRFPVKQTYTCAAADLTGHASDVTGATWVIATADAGDDLAHKITVRNDTATNHSTKTIVLVGTGANGEAITETIAAPNNAATVTSTKFFASLTSATVSATIGVDTFDIGWTAAAVTPWVDVDYGKDNFNVSIAVQKGGTINYDVQHTMDTAYDGAVAFNHASLAGQTASAYGNYTAPVVSVRANINSHTSGTVILYVLQKEFS